MTRNLSADRRAVSEVIGYVLVISLVITTIGIVSVSGISILQDAREAEQTENAERAFDLLADNMEDIYRQGAPSRSTEVQLGNARVISANTTFINVSGTDPGGGSFSHNYSVHTLTYRDGSGEALIYDAGAIFRTRNGDGVAVRPAPFIIGSDRTVITVPRLTADATTAVSGSTALLRSNRLGATVVENDTTGGSGYTNLQVDVTAPHWRAWNRTLNDRAAVTCSHPGGQTISCDLPDPDAFYLTKTDIRVELVR